MKKLFFLRNLFPARFIWKRNSILTKSWLRRGSFSLGIIFSGKSSNSWHANRACRGYKAQVKVVEVLEGVSPGSEITVQYPASPGFRALPKDYEAEDFYFIMGGVDNSGVVGLFGVESLFDGKTIANYHKPHWVIAWFYQMLSPCETV